MFGMGVTIDISDIKKVFNKPVWFLSALVLQFTMMPIIALLVIKFFKIDFEIGLGFIILGSCPGGTASNVITYLCKGNVALSITCTIISTISSVLLTPLIILVLADKSIDVDFQKIMRSTLFIVFFPTLFGLIFKKYLFKVNTKFLLMFPKLSEIFIALIIGIIFSLNTDNLSLVSEQLILGVMMHNLLGLALGYYVSKKLSFPNDVKKTISIEVGMQNSGLGMTLALLHFSKISSLPSAIFSLWHNISAIGLVYLWKKK
tara:strand:- start:583 stop:1362 length:780 start_codon:yes stop_codon:yes gene_type:complete